MKREEQIAAAYLGTLGLGTPIYEPDGNVPPDFLLPNSIAVEVRRLNKYVEVNGESEGIEQAEIPLMKAVETTLRRFDGAWNGGTYFVFIRFSRPLPDKKTLVAKLDNLLKTFLQKPS